MAGNPGLPIQLQPAPGIRRDGTRFDTPEYNDGLWCRWQRGKPRKMGGYRAIVSTLPGIPRGMEMFNQSGTNYVHIGSQSNLSLVTMDYLGNGTPPADRTPTIFIPNASNTWQMDIGFDPIAFNAATLYAHAGQNLSSIDNNIQTPVFYGSVTATTPLSPLPLPPTASSFTVSTQTANLTSGSTAVISIPDTAGITYGMTVTGTGIAPGTYVSAVTGVTTLTLSQAATTTTATTLTFSVGGVSGGVMVLPPYTVVFGSAGYVAYSTATNPADFWGLGSGEAYPTGAKFVAGKIARGGTGYSPSGLLWSLNAVVRMSFVGGDAIWSFDTLTDTSSIMSADSIVEVDGIFYWAGTDRFFMYNGVVKELPNDMNQNWFFDNINIAQRSKVFAYRVTRFGEIWWCYPRGNATECTHAVVYNYREGVWYDTPLPNNGRASALSPELFQYPVLGGVTPSSGAYTLWQHETGTDEVNGASTIPIESYFETNDTTFMDFPQKPMNNGVSCTIVEPDFIQSGDMTCQIIGNFNARAPDVYGEIKTFPATASNRNEQILRFKEVRRQMRFKFSSNVVGGNYQMGKVFAHIAPDGEDISG